ERLGRSDRGNHRDLALREAHPDAGGEVGRVTAEPGVQVRLDGAGLAGCWAVRAERRRAAGAKAAGADVDVVVEDLVHLRGGPGGERPPPGILGGGGGGDGGPGGTGPVGARL